MNLLDNMFIKRFCLPIDTDIESYENGSMNINSCLCGSYYHICYIFYKGTKKLTKLTLLSYGINTMGDPDGLKPGIHAEHDAIRKLCPLKKKKKLENIDILVIRLSKKNKLHLSKPCNNCIYTMKTLPNKLGYNIKNIFYSDENGNIIKTNLRELSNEEKYYTKFYKRQTTPKCNYQYNNITT